MGKARKTLIWLKILEYSLLEHTAKDIGQEEKKLLPAREERVL